jgi:hypothetical protein
MRISIFGYLRATQPAPVGLVYRLRQWPEHLPPTLRTANVLQALSLMSNRPVNRDWMVRHSTIKPAALDELLDILVSRGHVDVVDTSKFSLTR